MIIKKQPGIKKHIYEINRNRRMRITLTSAVRKAFLVNLS